MLAPRSLGTQAQHGAPVDMPMPNPGPRLASPIQREEDSGRRFDEAALIETKQLGVAGLQLGRAAIAVIGDLEPADLDILQEQIVGLHRRNAAGGEADHDEPAAPSERADGRGEYVAAEGVDDDVGDASIGDRKSTRLNSS